MCDHRDMLLVRLGRQLETFCVPTASASNV
uniref:Uncharacterized protein n=1 Tax=Anguilla anguilla TaxID=7936 RepID=A0A0E9PR73_ANGAN